MSIVEEELKEKSGIKLKVEEGNVGRKSRGKFWGMLEYKILNKNMGSVG